MNAVESTLRRVAKDLTGLRQRWALVGGFAVSARSEPRFTRDVDIVVAVANDDAAESLVRQLLTQQYHLLASVEQDAARRLAAVDAWLEVSGDPEVRQLILLDAPKPFCRGRAQR
ncbi:Nucleotidyl transferase of uncharacterised function (DUF1814) [Mycobacterium tuberculosis]|nr:Nucleotidyl transferase of uncharacterised function (DUF1814) [Mycobacterium tuberculosis]